jgi:hypothetical protein
MKMREDIVPTYVVFHVVERSAWPVHQLHDLHHEDVRGQSAHLCSVPRGREVCLACRQLYGRHHEDARGYSAHLCSVPRGRAVCLDYPPVQ